jgi:hypothetical protein
MAILYSNELKALVVPENILEMKSVLQERFTTVEKLHYCCMRKRNSRGEAYGPTEPVELEFCIRLNDPADAKPYYERLTNNENYIFSFVFNAVFAENTNLKDCEDGMICDGYVVGIKEHYSNTRETAIYDDPYATPQDEQMMLTVKLLLVNTTYLGENNNNYKSTFVYQE